MKLSDLSPENLKRLKAWRWDRIIEKHEGPVDWASVLRYGEPEFININGHDVLLPVGQDHHPQITVLRCIIGDGGQSLTLFLKDTTYVTDPECEFFQAGFVAVCDRFPGESFFVAVVYHEWFIVENEHGSSR